MKKVLLLTTLSSALLLTGCLTKELSVDKINSLHQKYVLSDAQVESIARNGCENLAGGPSMIKRGLVGYINIQVDVDIIGEIKKTYTNYPLNSGDLINGSINMLKGESTAIYKGICDTTKHITQDRTYHNRPSSIDEETMVTYHFIINPKECLERRNIKNSTCFTLDLNPITLAKSFTDGVSRIIGAERDKNSTEFNYMKSSK